MDIYNLTVGEITAIGICLLVVFFVIGLIAWFSRSRAQVKALVSIEAKLNNPGTSHQVAGVLPTDGVPSGYNMVDGQAPCQSHQPNQPDSMEPQNQTIESVEGEVQGREPEQVRASQPEIALVGQLDEADIEPMEPESEAEVASGTEELEFNRYNTGRSGRVFTKEELEELIKS